LIVDFSDRLVYSGNMAIARIKDGGIHFGNLGKLVTKKRILGPDAFFLKNNQ